MPDLKVFADEDLATSKLLFDVLAGETTNNQSTTTRRAKAKGISEWTP
jgi:hypothetical protein